MAHLEINLKAKASQDAVYFPKLSLEQAWDLISILGHQVEATNSSGESEYSLYNGTETVLSSWPTFVSWIHDHPHRKWRIYRNQFCYLVRVAKEKIDADHPPVPENTVIRVYKFKSLHLLRQHILKDSFIEWASGTISFSYTGETIVL